MTTRDFTEVFKELSHGYFEGDCSRQFKELTQRCSELQKAGQMTIKLKLQPNNDGTVEVLPSVETRMPTPTRGKSVFFITPENNLFREDPRQMKLLNEDSGPTVNFSAKTGEVYNAG